MKPLPVGHSRETRETGYDGTQRRGPSEDRLVDLLRASPVMADFALGVPIGGIRCPERPAATRRWRAGREQAMDLSGRSGEHFR